MATDTTSFRCNVGFKTNGQFCSIDNEKIKTADSPIEPQPNWLLSFVLTVYYKFVFLFLSFFLVFVLNAVTLGNIVNDVHTKYNRIIQSSFLCGATNDDGAHNLNAICQKLPIQQHVTFYKSPFRICTFGLSNLIFFFKAVDDARNDLSFSFPGKYFRSEDLSISFVF